MRRLLLLCLVFPLTACLSLEELPAGATGFLVVDDATLDGTVNGERIDGDSARATGYCTAAGWHVELRARAGDDEVMATLDVDDLSMWGRSAEVRFVETDGDFLTVEDDEEPGALKALVCTGDDMNAPETEARADVVVLEIEDTDQGDIDVEFTAQLATGDEVHGQFTMEMPLVD